MSEENRATLTGALWFFSALALVALFISAAAQGELTPGHLILAFVILGLAVAGTPFLLRWTGSETQQAKAKRERLESLLRAMSTEDFIALKQRLAEGDNREDAISDYLSDDGEMVWRS